MRKFGLMALAVLLASGTAYAQNNNHRGGPDNNPAANNHGANNNAPGNHGPANNHGPAMAPQPHPMPAAHPGPAMAPQPHVMPAAARNMGRGGNNNRGGHHLPPGISIPTARHSAPQWHGRSWGVGDTFILTGFNGPYIRDWSGYALSAPRPGTHWIYVDGYYLMIGNRSGRIFAEVPADY